MTLPKLLSLDCDYFRKYEKAVRKFLTTTPWPEQVEFYTKFGTSPVLAHGDMWMNNIFFKNNDEGNVTDELCAFLDWQLAAPNTGIGDLGHLILIGANAKLREAHLDEWLELYYDTFEASTKRFGVPNQYTLDVVKEMFRHHYPSELIFALLVLSLSFEKTTEQGQKNLVERMISCFEVVRKNYE
ncbi:hypothetical protein AAVH_20719 [Aphelenchoides avenae]|nr:hypothetical protein AAVH_20719 [Aphelenchus avenae]